MKFKPNKKQQHFQKQLDNLVYNETQKIDLNQINEEHFLYQQFKKIPKKKLVYKLKYEKLTGLEKDIIKQILKGF